MTEAKRRPEGLLKNFRIARHPHQCSKCGAVIEIGDKMTMVTRNYRFWPLCLKCSEQEVINGR